MNLFRGISLISIILLLNGCSGNQSIESLFSPNSNLTSPRPNNNQTPNNNNNNNSNNNNNPTPEENNKLPEDFPPDIPIYQSAKLVSITDGDTSWTSDDPLNLITNYYQTELVKQEWNLTNVEENLIVAQKQPENRELNISFSIVNNQTRFVISTTNKLVNSNNNNQNTTNNNQELPASLQELIRLNIIASNSELSPYKIITRRQYARWLVETNNRIYANVNSKLVRLANPNSKAIYSDVPNNDPDFAVIQGLAEAGLIASSLTQDTTAIAFNPDKALNREDLIAWKVPLDFRQNLPNTTLDNIKETWGFQDANKITPQTWAELYVDWQNGENANIRKAFGYITLFQPQKEVSYEEAAEVLSSFGYQGEITLLKEIK